MGLFSAPYEIVEADVATVGAHRYLATAAFHQVAWKALLHQIEERDLHPSNAGIELRWACLKRYRCRR